MFSDPLTQQLATFVRGIGIDVKAAVLAEPTFVPGLDIQYGTILLDQPRLSYPGDILHEAGHIAVTAPQSRKEPRLSPDGGDEMAALAWSYAAARHLKLDPSVVFHSGGYKGGSPALIENFAAGNYLGVPLLQFYGMTVESRSAAARGAKPYPHMLCWLRCNA